MFQATNNFIEKNLTKEEHETLCLGPEPTCKLLEESGLKAHSTMLLDGLWLLQELCHLFLASIVCDSPHTRGISLM